MSAPHVILAEVLGTEQAVAVLQALDRAGWVVVPRVPTKAMLDAGWYSAHDEDPAGTWRYMIEAAPN
jgi:hypothetical protein